MIICNLDARLIEMLKDPIPAARYSPFYCQSLPLIPETLPSCLSKTNRSTPSVTPSMRGVSELNADMTIVLLNTS